MSNEETEAGDSRPLPIAGPAIKLLDGVTKLAFYLSAATLATIVSLYCMEIVLRYFFLSPTVWSRDTVTYLLCGTILLAAPEVARTNSHVAITIAVEMCGSKTKQRVETILALIAAVVAAGVCWVTAGETLRLFNSGILTLGTIPLPKWWMSIFIPIGFFLISLQYLTLAIDKRRRGHDRTQI